jgi:hypothetical protein
MERRNQMVVKTARSMMKAKGMLDIFWAEAVATAVYVLNRSPAKGITGMTPFEAWYGKKSVVHHLHTFDYVAYVRNLSPNLKKLDDKSQTMVFIRYEWGTKGYRVYDPVSQMVRVTHDIVFDEQAIWDWGKEEYVGDPGADTFTIEYTMIRESSVTKEAEQAAGDQLDVVPNPLQWTCVGGQHSDQGNQVVGSGGVRPELDADHEEGLLVRIGKLDDVLADLDRDGQQLHIVSSDEPGSLAEAQANPCWKQDMEEEMAAIEENQTWPLCELPQGCPCNWSEVGI